jgi:hypothetical protein
MCRNPTRTITTSWTEYPRFGREAALVGGFKHLLGKRELFAVL